MYVLTPESERRNDELGIVSLLDKECELLHRFPDELPFVVSQFLDRVSSNVDPADFSFEGWAKFAISCLIDAGISTTELERIACEIAEQSDAKILKNPKTGDVVWNYLELIEFYDSSDLLEKDEISLQDFLSEHIYYSLSTLLKKKYFVEVPDCTFRPGMQVYVILTEDNQYHPGTVIREVAFNQIWENENGNLVILEELAKSAAEDLCTTNSGDSGIDRRFNTEELFNTEDATKDRKKKKAGNFRKANSKKKQTKDLKFFEVQFTEFGDKRQIARSDTLVSHDNVVDDGAGSFKCSGLVCEMCERDDVDLTFHHLIPKETHNRWLKKKAFPPGFDPSKVTLVRGSASSKRCANKAMCASIKRPNRLFLNLYGTMVCGPCHAKIHSIASNEILSVDYNTIDQILKVPTIQEWVRFRARGRK